MEKLKQSIFNIIFYIVIIAIILGLIFLLLFVVLKLNVYAMEEVPSQKICVLIDPGHGAADGGAVSDTGVIEKDINLAISKYLKEYLETSGFEVKMTRYDDNILGDQTLPTQRERYLSDMHARLEMYNDKHVDYVISIHQNKFEKTQYKGTQIFYSSNNKKSRTLAENLRKAITSFLQPDNSREIVEAGSNIYLLNNCNNPCVLIECGFLSNPEETELLTTEEYQRQMAFSIYCGLLGKSENGG